MQVMANLLSNAAKFSPPGAQVIVRASERATRVRVEVEDLLTGHRKHTSSAYLTFVAIDKSGRRVRIGPVIPETDDEKRRFAEAEERRAYRLAMRDKVLRKLE